MVTPEGGPDFGGIVLPIPMPLLYLGSLSTILRNQASTDGKERLLRVLTDGLMAVRAGRAEFTGSQARTG
jgi:hypothetical protein